jgi:hypothetical protein
MKGAPLRISSHATRAAADSDRQSTLVSKYAGAVTKLIPGEVVSAYAAGKSFLLSDTETFEKAWAKYHPEWIAWTIFCFVMVILFRSFTTSDKAAGDKIEWSSVIVAAFSFVVWIYAFGDVFQGLGHWSKVSAGLVLFGWSLFAPFLLFGLKKVWGEDA